MPMRDRAATGSEAGAWYRERAGSVELRLRVTPRAARAAVGPVVAEADGGCRLKVAVTAPPEGGRANDAVIALLAEALGAPRSALALAHGASGRSKTVRVDGAYRSAVPGLAGPESGEGRGP